MTYESPDIVSRMKKPIILVTIAYSLVKFLNHFILYPEYAPSRVISGSVLIAAALIFSRLNMSSRMAAIVLPYSYVIIELTVVLLTGGDRVIYVFFIGTGLLSLIFVDTIGLVIKMLLTLFTILFLLFGLDMRLLWVDAPIADEIFNFLGTFLIYALLFMLSKFIVSIAVAQLTEKDLFKIMIDTSPNVIALMDMSGKVIDVNKAALSFYGYESRQEYMDSFQKSIPKYQPNGIESIPFMLNFWKEVMEGGEVRLLSQWMRQTSTGELRPTDVIVAPIHGDAIGEILRLAFISKYKQAGVLLNKILENQEELT